MALKLQEIDYELTYEKNAKDKLAGQMRDMKNLYEGKVEQLEKDIKELQEAQSMKLEKPEPPGYYLKQGVSPSKREIYARTSPGSQDMRSTNGGTRRSQGILTIPAQDILYSEHPRDSQEMIKVPASPQSVLPPLQNQPLTPQSQTEKRIRLSFSRRQTDLDLIASTVQNEEPPILNTEPSPLAPQKQEELTTNNFRKQPSEEIKKEDLKPVQIELNISPDNESSSSEEEEQQEIEVTQPTTLKRSNSLRSEFSLASDIGAIAGVPHLNEFNPPGLIGLNEKSGMFYKQAVFLDKGVLFEDYKVQVGYIRQKIKMEEILGFRVSLFIGNKNGSYPLNQFMLIPKNLSQEYFLVNKTDNPSIIVPPRKQERRVFEVKLSPFKSLISGPLISMDFQVNDEKHSTPLRMPLLLVQLAEPYDLESVSEIDFDREYDGLGHQEKRFFTPDFSRLNSMKKVEALLKHQNRFATLRPMVNAYFGKGGLYLACVIGKRKVMAKLKISPSLNRSELWLASEDEQLTRGAVVGLLELMSMNGPGIPKY